MKAKSLKKLFKKKLLVIKEICSWLQTFRPSNPGGFKTANIRILSANSTHTS